MRVIILVASLWLVTSPLWGKIVFYSQRDGNEEIYTMDTDGRNQTRLTFNGMRDSDPVWSPNGRQIAFRSTRDGNSEVYVMDADGHNRRNLTQHPASDGRPAWSPDGNQIVFGRFPTDGAADATFDLYLMDADGNNVKQLTHMRGEHWELASRPSWSPDGEWILFEGDIVEGNLEQGRQIYAMRPDGTKRWQVSEPVPGVFMFSGRWSPDGRQIVYYANVGLNVNNIESFVVIATLDPIGGAKVIKRERVPLPKMPFHSPSFGADGKSILFSGKKDLHWNIYRFGLVNKQLIQLTDNPREDSAPQEWNPRLPVSPRGLDPKRWGEIKSESLRTGNHD